MAFWSVETIGERINEIKRSYEKQLARSGLPGYDHNLTSMLKNDLCWLLEQQQKLMDPDFSDIPLPE
jgi:hypothetical protein